METHQEQFEHIACRVCGKPVALSGDDCYNTYGRSIPLCQQAKACRIHEKTQEQYRYVLSSPDTNTFLRACPGSGKTEVVGLKAAYEIRRWNRRGGIAVLTFTNNAANVITDRVLQFVGADRVAYPHYIGTIDSWLHGYIANPFGHAIMQHEGNDGDRRIRVIADNDSGEWLNAFKCKTPYYFSADKGGGIPLTANAIRCGPQTGAYAFLRPLSEDYQWMSDEEYYRSEAFTGRRKKERMSWLTLAIMRDGFRDAKERFWRSGFATYQDIEYVCSKLLQEYPDLLKRIACRFPLIMIDECQDLSPAQLCLLRLLINAGCSTNLVGDMNQGIYAFRGTAPEQTERFVREHADAKLCLSENFRSRQPIVDVCSSLIPDGRITGRKHVGRKPACVYYAYTPGEETELVPRFAKYLELRGLNTTKAAILARGHSMVSKLRPGKVQADVQRIKAFKKPALAIHLWKSGSRDSRDEALQCLGSFVAAAFYGNEHTGRRHHYCPGVEPSPLRWRRSLYRILDECMQDPVLGNLEDTWGEWLSALKKVMPPIVRRNCTDACPTAELQFKVPPDLKQQTVSSSLDTATGVDRPELRITTIHDIKGETLDAVLVVSSKRKGTGGHWQEWLHPDNGKEEYKRYAFVASSRPRYLLAWAIPSPSPEEEQEIERLGFTKLPV